MRTSLFNHIIHTNSHLNSFIFEFQMPPRKVRQTVIGGTGFVGSKLLTLEDVKKIKVEHINHIPDKLLLNWEDILNEGSSLLKDLTPDLIWPLPRSTTANQGMNGILFSYSTPPSLI